MEQSIRAGLQALSKTAEKRFVSTLPTKGTSKKKRFTGN
jgi:hypothetical protein